jgi:ABC-type multidrug transport system fused ATPase/permease subunit
LKYLRPYIKKYKFQSILAPAFKMLEAGFDLTVPLLVARIIDDGIAAGNSQVIWTNFALMLLMALLGLACSFTAQFFAAKAAIGSAAGLRRDLLQHIQSLSFTELDTIGTATLITRMTSDINQVQNGINMFLRLFLRSPFIVFGAMVMVFTLNTHLALIFVAAIGILFVIVFGIMKITNPKYKQTQRNLDSVTAATRENLNGVRVIRAFGREETQVREFAAINEKLAASQRNVGKISAMMNPLTYVVVNGAIIAVLWLGAGKVENGLLLRGDLVAMINYIGQILIELVKLANLIVLLSKAMASLGRVEQILDTESSMTFHGTEYGKDSESILEFQNVALQFKGAGAESVAGISFSLKKGQTLGVIGGTGSGKSTLVNLIPRFYDATEGTVYLKGVPVQNLREDVLRKSVAIVQQKAQLFAGTIRSNLLWGNEHATDEELWQALETAQAADFVKDKGLDAPVEQGGRNLSGGQKQRLTIARALLCKPEILILDDSASALDYATDAALRGAIQNLPGHMTLVIVSQRTASIQQADQILVLEDGVLAGKGTHGALLESCPVYREIYESQFRKEEA